MPELDPFNPWSIVKPGMSANYTGPLIQACVTQAIFLLFAGTIMDTGYTQRIVALASIPFWGVVLLVIYRIPPATSRTARLFIRWGLIPIVLAGTFVVWWISTVR